MLETCEKNKHAKIVLLWLLKLAKIISYVIITMSQNFQNQYNDL